MRSFGRVHSVAPMSYNQPPGGPGWQNPNQPQNPYQTPHWQAGANPYGQHYSKSSNAILALVLSILGSLCCCTLTAPVGMYLGKSEMNAIDEGLADPQQRGTAQAAFVVGIIGTVILVLTILYYIASFLFLGV